MDVFSSLPDEIVCQILSSLSTKEAALTCALAKRWRYLFLASPNLRFEEKDFSSDPYIPKSFGGFLERVLGLLDVPHNDTLRFSLICRKGAQFTDINSWICNLLNHGRTLDLLALDVVATGVTPLPLPIEVFTCKTIVKLKLGKWFVIQHVPEDASLPALKTLSLDRIKFSSDAFQALFSACHVLEELQIRFPELSHGFSCSMSCITLRRLTIKFKNFSVLYIIFDTPSLANLDYSGSVQNEYSLGNLDSLVEAKLAFRAVLFPEDVNPSNMMTGLRNVATLNLSTPVTLEVLNSWGEEIPMLENLSRLSIKTDYGFWKYLPLLLKKSPNLETLIIEGPSKHYNLDYGVSECLSGYSFLLSCHVKVIEITRFWGTIGEFAQLKHLVEKLPCLELLKVHAWGEDEKAKLQVATYLLMLPRACKIQLKFFSLGGDANLVLENLSRLSIKTNHEFWRFLRSLFKTSLVIEGPSSRSRAENCGVHDFVSEYCLRLSSGVKVIKIKRFWGTSGEFVQIKHILDKLPCLELLKVHAWGEDEKAKLQVATDLLMLPRACKIQLKFFNEV